MDPVIWFFLLGLFAGVAKADLRFPPAIYDLLSTLLLLTIGLKGGVELAKSPFAGLLPQILLVLTMGFLLPLLIFPLTRVLGRLGRADAASLAAHYGSVSVATFAVGVSTVPAALLRARARFAISARVSQNRLSEITKRVPARLVRLLNKACRSMPRRFPSNAFMESSTTWFTQRPFATCFLYWPSHWRPSPSRETIPVMNVMS